MEPKERLVKKLDDLIGMIEEDLEEDNLEELRRLDALFDNKKEEPYGNGN